MGLKQERRDDAEIATPAAQRPEEVGVLLGARRQQLAFGADDLEREDVVAGQAMLSHQPADAAPEGQAGDAGPGDDTRGHRQAMQVRFAIDIAERRPALDPRRTPARVDENAPHPGQIDHDSVVAQRTPGDVVAAAPDGNQQVVRAREPDRMDDIGGSTAPDDHAWTLLDAGIPDPPRAIIVGVRWQDHPAGDADAARELLDESAVDRSAASVLEV